MDYLFLSEAKVVKNVLISLLVLTLILTAPIHCSGSIGEQIM